LEKLSTDVSIKQKQQVVDLLQEYDDIFSKGTYDMGRTNLLEHTFNTGYHRPIRQFLRHHPRAHLDEIDRQIELQQNSNLLSAHGHPTSNVVLVKKRMDLIDFVLTTDNSTLLITRTHILCRTSILVLNP